VIIVSIKVDKKVKEILEKAGVYVNKELKDFWMSLHGN